MKGMRIEFRLTDDGHLLDPDHSDSARYRAATKSWVVQSLPASNDEQRELQADLLHELHMTGTGDKNDARELADVLLHDSSANPEIPRDVVALRVALLQLSSKGPQPVIASQVHLAARGNQTVTTSTDESALRRLVDRVTSLTPERRKGDYVVIRALLWLVVDDGTAIVDQVAGRTAQLEDAVFASQEPDDDVVEDIYANKRIMAELRRNLLPVINRLGFISDTDKQLDKKTTERLDRVRASLHRLSDSMDTDDRLLGDILAAQMTIVQVQ